MFRMILLFLFLSSSAFAQLSADGYGETGKNDIRKGWWSFNDNTGNPAVGVDYNNGKGNPTITKYRALTNAEEGILKEELNHNKTILEALTKETESKQQVVNNSKLIKSNEKEIKKLKKELEPLEEAKSTNESEIQIINEVTNPDLESRNDEIDVELEKLESKIEKLADLISANNPSLVESINLKAAAEISLGVTNSNILKLEGEKNTLNKNMLDNLNLLTIKKNSLSSLEVGSLGYDANKATLETEITVIEAENKAIQAKLDEITEPLGILQADKTSSEGSIAIHQSTIESLTAKDSVNSSRLTELTNEKTALEIEKKNNKILISKNKTDGILLVRANKDLTAKIDDIKTKITELKDMNKRLSSTSSDEGVEGDYEID